MGPGERMLFWALLAGVGGVLVAPLWASSLPPLTDFGPHATMVEVWVGYEESPLYQDWYLRQDTLDPNLLLARFGRLCAPLLAPVDAVRLWVSLWILATLGALLVLARSLRASPWFCLLGLPLVWWAPVTVGLLNFVPVVPLMLLGLALGRRWGEVGPSRGTLLLAVALGLFSYFVHAFGLPFVGLFTFAALVGYLRRPRDLLALLAFLPALALWLRWAAGMSEAGRQVRSHYRWQDPLSFLWDVAHWTSRVFSEHHLDTAVLLGLLLLWAFALRGQVSRPGLLRTPGGPRWLPRRGLPRVLAILLISMAALPAFASGPSVSHRLVSPALMLLGLAPGIRIDVRRARGLGLGAALLGLIFGASLLQGMREFERREYEPLLGLIERIPEGSYSACVGVLGVGARPVFLHDPLRHGCAALVQLRTHGIAGHAFAGTHYNAIVFQPGKEVPFLGESWRDRAAHRRFEYLVVRGEHEAPSPGTLSLVGEAEPWSLYRVRRNPPKGRYLRRPQVGP